MAGHNQSCSCKIASNCLPRKI